MSKDLEKLAAEMQKMTPSTTSRNAGMDAAMAAFSAEFTSETEAVKTAAEQNNSQTSQGLDSAARPTGQTIGTKPVDTFRSDMMSKLKSVLSFDMKTTMMMGSCAAALMFAAVIDRRKGLLPSLLKPLNRLKLRPLNLRCQLRPIQSFLLRQIHKMKSLRQQGPRLPPLQRRLRMRTPLAKLQQFTSN